MGYVTPEQIAQAKEWDLLTYLQQYDPHQLVHVGEVPTALVSMTA